MELLISEEVGSLQLDDGRVPQEGRDFHTGIKDALHHAALIASDHSPLVDSACFAVFH
jgi:hypothetical protein